MNTSSDIEGGINTRNTVTEVQDALSSLKSHFAEGKTLPVSVRKEALHRLHKVIRQRENDIATALKSDLGKSAEEAYLTETAMVLREIRMQMRHLEEWSKTKRVPTPFFLLPSSSRIVHQPLGVALIMAPWNYPLQMVVAPLAGAIAAGCCVLVKPSPDAPATSAILQEIITAVFDPGHVCLLRGGIPLAQELLRHRFDVIFFTGSPAVGRIVMRAAAEHLTPVILELGGKSPCIVDDGADINVAARRIAWGKLLNAGQTCIAPDYLLVKESLKADFIQALRQQFDALLGNNPKNNPHYARIIDAGSMQRLQSMMQEGNIIHGGSSVNEERFIEPTVIGDVPEGSDLRSREIFGPLLPVYSFHHLDDAIARINADPPPLALYYFGKGDAGDEVVRRTRSGGVCINDTVLHIANPHLPFGGIGESGIGRYRGRYSFEAFSHYKPVLKSMRSFDLPMRYPPYRFFRWMKRLL